MHGMVHNARLTDRPKCIESHVQGDFGPSNALSLHVFDHGVGKVHTGSRCRGRPGDSRIDRLVSRLIVKGSSDIWWNGRFSVDVKSSVSSFLKLEEKLTASQVFLHRRSGGRDPSGTGGELNAITRFQTLRGFAERTP
jgi:hypothetical protein